MGIYELVLFFCVLGCGYTSYRIGYYEGTRKGIDTAITGCFAKLRKKGIIPADVSMKTFLGTLTE